MTCCLKAVLVITITSPFIQCFRSARVTVSHSEQLAAKTDPMALVTDALSKTEQGAAILKQAQSVMELGAKWKSILEALEDVKGAATESGTAVSQLGTTLTEINDKISELELDSLFDGKIDENDLQLLGHAETCLDIVVKLLSCAEVMDVFADLATKIINIAIQIKELTDETAELAGVWADVDFGSAVPELAEKVTQAAVSFHEEASRLSRINNLLKPLLGEWDEKNYMEKGYHLTMHGEEIISGFNELGWAWTDIQTLYKEDAQPVQSEMEGVIAKMVSIGSSFALPGGDTTGTGATETIDASECDGRNIRRFEKKAADSIDTSTMTCWTEPVVGGMWCSCKSEDDCYVRREKRPAPTEKKRCFKKK